MRGPNKPKNCNKTLMLLDLDVQYAVSGADLPPEAALNTWVAAALELAQYRPEDPPQLTIRIVDEAEGRELNETWRHKLGPTNVLSFPYEAPSEVVDIPLLGDIVICAPVVLREAAEQHKAPTAHWAHLVIHGCLHLLGFDHQEEAEAEAMETLEQRILAHLGFPDPYGERADTP